MEMRENIEQSDIDIDYLTIHKFSLNSDKAKEYSTLNGFSSFSNGPNKNDLFSTPVKKNKRFCSDDTQDRSNFMIDCQESYVKNANKHSIEECKFVNKLECGVSPKLSPFSKHCANLSPLYKGSERAPRQFNDPKFSKFSVEFMKSPNARRMEDDSIEEDRIDFNFEGDFENNDTPTFKSVPDDTIVKQFPFLENKENIDVNRKIECSVNSNCSQNSHKEEPDNEIDCCSHHQNEEKAVELDQLYNKSRGSTSPESNCNFLKDHQACIKRTEICNSECSDYNQILPLFQVKKREYKQRSKKNQLISKLGSDLQNKTKKAGCTCKKSQCRKLYCECFLSQKECTSACSCFSCCNTDAHADEILQIRNSILSKNPNAFKDKLAMLNRKDSKDSANLAIHSKGCKCKKSKCQTGYCECHQLGARCSELCKCESCENQPQADSLASITL